MEISFKTWSPKIFNVNYILTTYYETDSVWHIFTVDYHRWDYMQPLICSILYCPLCIETVEMSAVNWLGKFLHVKNFNILFTSKLFVKYCVAPLIKSLSRIVKRSFLSIYINTYTIIILIILSIFLTLYISNS